jgi:hypothetical protein
MEAPARLDIDANDSMWYEIIESVENLKKKEKLCLILAYKK